MTDPLVDSDPGVSVPSAPDDLERRVLDRIGIDDLVALTRALIGQPGENPPGGEAGRARVLREACEREGLLASLVEVEPDRPNFSAVLPGGDEPGLLVLGHTDVVPIGEGWTVDPLGGELRDGRLHGRGATDMLGGLGAVVVAMTAIADAGVRLRGPVELSAVMDEEETGKGIRHYLLSGDRSGFAGCVVAEPTDLQTIIAARGDSYLHTTMGGKAAHSGNPANGRNAIDGAARVIAEFGRWHDELAANAHPLVGPATVNVGLVSGGTGTSIVPAECRITTDRRLLPSETGADALGQARERVAALDLAAKGLTCEVELTMEMPGFETPTDHRLVTTLDRAAAECGGPGLPLAGWTAACDGGFIARDAEVPVVVFGPGSVTDQAHQADESVGVDELLVAARTYALTMLRLLGVESADR